MAGHHDLANLSLADITILGRALRSMSDGCASLEQFAQRVTGFLYEAFEDDDGRRQLALVRWYLTATPAQVRALGVSRPLPEAAAGTGRHLALVASRGLLPEWNDRRRSAGHQVIPLDDQALRATPMISALLQQLGVPIAGLARRPQVLGTGADSHFGVFHVQEAHGSGHIPAQTFVAEHGIRSAVGIGGLLPDGELFTVVLFSQVSVSEATAALFRTISLNVRLGVLALDGLPLLEPAAVDGPAGQKAVSSPSGLGAAGGRRRARTLRAERAMLQQLLVVHEQTAITESTRAVELLRRWRTDAERATLLARTLQDSLLPPALPAFDGLHPTGVFRPAGDGSEIGGDFYDVFATDNHRGWFIVGDVAGKGAAAAALTALARHTFRAVTTGTLATPTSVLQRINDALLASSSERHLTALLGTLRIEEGIAHISLALAGHPPPLLIPAEGPIHEVGVPGTALGLFPTIELTTVRTTLSPGDVLIAFTDGVPDARSPDGAFYGQQRLIDLLDRSRGAPAEQLAEEVAQDVLSFQDNWAADDIAIVTLTAAR